MNPYDNVPDDWDGYWYKCERCGKRYHGSEGGCPCEEDTPEYWGDIPPVEDLDLEIEKAEEYFSQIEKNKEKGRP